MTIEPKNPASQPDPEDHRQPAKNPFPGHGVPAYPPAPPAPPAPHGNQGYPGYPGYQGYQGYPMQQQVPYAGFAQQPRTNTLAVIAFISSFFLSLAGVIMGHLALNQIKRTGEGGRGLAIAALVLGYAGIAFGLILLIIFVGAYNYGY